MPDLGGMSRVMPVASGYFIVAALAGMGVPGFASFWAEVTVFVSALKVRPLLAVPAIGALVLSALYMLRVVQRTFYGERNERYAQLPDVSFGLGLPRMILVATMLLFGLFPGLMLDLIQTAVIPFMNGLPR